ncbi:MAG: helicase C-terminal domain-containing protein, partial [Syntrophomonadaceae bacterium]
ATAKIFAGFTRGLALQPDYSFTHILTPADKEQAWMAEILDIYAQEWTPGLDLLLQRLGELNEELEGEAEGADLLEIISGLRETDNTVFSILNEGLNCASAVTWVDFRQGKASALCTGGVDAGSLLAGKLYERLKTLVMVSATLAVEDKFDNFVSRSGLQQWGGEERLVTHLEHSPFDYERQACLYVAEDMPDPGSSSFNAAVFQVLADIFAAQGGQTMVLFTSRQQMQEASLALKPYCRQQGLNLLVQHEDGDFGSLMDDFVYGDNCILMGVETFWEGIDLRGDALSCLVIVRLPFRSPSDPYCSAWEQYYRTACQSSFKHFMLPDAALRFKQGVGRLIRSETDQGAVVVLDKRLVDRQYGQIFRASIPIQNLIRIPRGHLPGELRKCR